MRFSIPLILAVAAVASAAAVPEPNAMAGEFSVAVSVCIPRSNNLLQN